MRFFLVQSRRLYFGKYCNLTSEWLSRHGVLFCLFPFNMYFTPKGWSYCQLEHLYTLIEKFKISLTNICRLIDIYTRYLLGYVYNVQLTFLCCHFQLVHSCRFLEVKNHRYSKRNSSNISEEGRRVNTSARVYMNK